jgi:hypothetical protein
MELPKEMSKHDSIIVQIRKFNKNFCTKQTKMEEGKSTRKATHKNVRNRKFMDFCVYIYFCFSFSGK